MDIKLAVFDFDGTIADTRKTIVIAKQQAMKQLGLEVKDEETCASTIGLSAKAGFKKTYPDISEELLNECVILYRKLFDEVKSTMPPEIFPGVLETLDWLKEQGIKLTIATSRNTASLKEFVAALNLSKYFSYMLGGDDTKLLKPNPEPVMKTQKDLFFSPEQTLVIGDMPVDIAMGKGADAYTCGVTYGNATREQLREAGADFIVDKMQELRDIIK